jgi:penicillin G amidase
LRRTPRQSPATSAAIQADTLSLAAQHLVPLMTRIAPADPLARQAIAPLRNWDFHMDRAAVGPLLFTAWLREFSHTVFLGHVGAAAAGYFRADVIEAVLRDHPEWCGPPTAHTKSCDGLLVETLQRAVEQLRQTYGADLSQWVWGHAHVAEFRNPLFSRIPLLHAWVDVGIATGGGFDTINRGLDRLPEGGHPFDQTFGAGLRIITDLAAPRDSRMIAVPGQSGNPLSPHFSDLLQRWRDFVYLVPGRAPAVATLTLEPAR